jgi:RNA polymerase sigma-70 factor (ECF subfamily)
MEQLETITTKETVFDAALWVDAHGDFLYSFAFSRVRDQWLAEDLVQDTLLAAMQAKNSFESKSS